MSGFMLHGLGDCTPERHCGCLDIPAMTAPEPTPTAEHIDAVAFVIESAWSDGDDATIAHAILTSTDPAVHEALAANLPADAMLDALARAGVPTEHTFQSFGGKWTLTLSTEPRAIDQDEALDLLRKRLTGEVAP